MIGLFLGIYLPRVEYVVTREEKQLFARAGLGFTEGFGQGQFASFMEQSPVAAAQFNKFLNNPQFRSGFLRSRVQRGAIETQDTTRTLLDATTALRGVKAFSGAGSAIVDAAGAKLAPSLFGRGAPIPGGVGPSAPGAVTSAGGSLSGIISGAGIGYLAGTLNPFTENQQQSQVGGTVGGAIGSIFGPVGTGIGSVLGAAVGGLFGPGRKHPAATFGTSISETGQFTDLSFKAKHIGTEFAEGAAAETQAFTEALGQLGFSFQQAALHGGVDDSRGLAALDIRGERKQTIDFDPDDQVAASNALAQVAINAIDLTKSNDAQRRAIESLDTKGKTTGQIIAELSQTLGAPGAENKRLNELSEGAEPRSAAERITRKVFIQAEQTNKFLEAVKTGKVGKAATIRTSPRGIVEEPFTRKRRLFAVPTINQAPGSFESAIVVNQ